MVNKYKKVDLESDDLYHSYDHYSDNKIICYIITFHITIILSFLLYILFYL